MFLPLFLSGLLASAPCPSQDNALAEAADSIENRYVLEAEARAVSRHLREAVASGRYSSTCGDTAAFVESVNRDLDLFDGHFFLEHVGMSDDSAAADWLNAWRAGARGVNAGIREVRVLEGNIGYLRIASWYPMDTAGPKLQAALALLADVDGLILDVRGNGGGDATTPSQLVRSLLPPAVTAVQDIERRSGREEDLLPAPELPAVRADIPVVVLIDRRSASASEFVAYALQAAGRASVVGSRSAGVAHMIGEPVDLPGGYKLAIPDARPVSRVTGRNWEGVGVTPETPGGDDPLHVARRQLETRRTAPAP